jgi:hypothetical protein
MYCILILVGHHEHERNLGFSLFQTKDGVNHGFCLWSCAIVVLFITIVMWNRSSFIALLMFYSLACLSFFSISFSWIPIIIDIFFDWILSFSKLPEYQCRIRLRQYRINCIFKKKNMKIKMIWSPIDPFRPFSSQAASLEPVTTRLSVGHRILFLCGPLDPPTNRSLILSKKSPGFFMK